MNEEIKVGDIVYTKSDIDMKKPYRFRREYEVTKNYGDGTIEVILIGSPSFHEMLDPKPMKVSAKYYGKE